MHRIQPVYNFKEQALLFHGPCICLQWHISFDHSDCEDRSLWCCASGWCGPSDQCAAGSISHIHQGHSFSLVALPQMLGSTLLIDTRNACNVYDVHLEHVTHDRISGEPGSFIWAAWLYGRIFELSYAIECVSPSGPIGSLVGDGGIILCDGKVDSQFVDSPLRSSPNSFPELWLDQGPSHILDTCCSERCDGAVPPSPSITDFDVEGRFIDNHGCVNNCSFSFDDPDPHGCGSGSPFTDVGLFVQCNARLDVSDKLLNDAGMIEPVSEISVHPTSGCSHVSDFCGVVSGVIRPSDLVFDDSESLVELINKIKVAASRSIEIPIPLFYELLLPDSYISSAGVPHSVTHNDCSKALFKQFDDNDNGGDMPLSLLSPSCFRPDRLSCGCGVKARITFDGGSANASAVRGKCFFIYSEIFNHIPSGVPAPCCMSGHYISKVRCGHIVCSATIGCDPHFTVTHAVSQLGGLQCHNRGCESLHCDSRTPPEGSCGNYGCDGRVSNDYACSVGRIALASSVIQLQLLTPNVLCLASGP